jgi:aspartate/methionine/tyrosine aminotransferase
MSGMLNHGVSGTSADQAAEWGGPDEFMFSQFRVHSSILRQANRYDYVMLSGGANYIPAPKVWKDLIRLEIDQDFTYGWYTYSEGFPTLQRAVSMFENYAASNGRFPDDAPLGRRVCLTFGASQAAAAVFDYIAASTRDDPPSVLLPGFNYSLFDRLARHHRFRIVELLGNGDRNHAGSPILPSSEAIADRIERERISLLVLTLPNNPSGELYSDEDIALILTTAAHRKTVVLIDEVGRMPLAQPWRTTAGQIVCKTGTQDNTVFINSFSKSDGVPGFRIGYLSGPQSVIAHAGTYQSVFAMNPSTFPVLPVFFTLLARTVHLGIASGWISPQPGAREEILSFARHMFAVTTAIPRQSLLAAMEEHLSPSGFDRDYGSYLAHQLEVDRIIECNRTYLFASLGEYISRATSMAQGFNMLIELTGLEGLDELAVCEELLHRAGVGVLTESCFRSSVRRRPSFWIRISLAYPADAFRRGVDRLADYMCSGRQRPSVWPSHGLARPTITAPA